MLTELPFIWFLYFFVSRWNLFRKSDKEESSTNSGFAEYNQYE